MCRCNTDFFRRERNLTEKYYAEKALRYAQQIHLKREWEEYLALPGNKQLLETGLYQCKQSIYCMRPKQVHVSSAKLRTGREDVQICG